MAIDTLKVARRLREAGFSEPQAEAVIAAVQEAAEGADLVTNADLAVFKSEVKAEFAAFKSEVKAEFAAVRAEMREMEQRLNARIEAIKAEMLGRIMQMILGALLVNIVAMLGALFAFAKLLGH